MMRGRIALAAVAAISLGVISKSIRPVKEWANPYPPAVNTGRPGAKFARKALEGKIGKRG